MILSRVILPRMKSSHGNLTNRLIWVDSCSLGSAAIFLALPVNIRSYSTVLYCKLHSSHGSVGWLVRSFPRVPCFFRDIFDLNLIYNKLEHSPPAKIPTTDSFTGLFFLNLFIWSACWSSIIPGSDHAVLAPPPFFFPSFSFLLS